MDAPLLEQRLLTVDEYHAMAHAGILCEDDRLELIDGKITLMSPVGDPHIACINRLDRLFHERLIREEIADVYVSVQNPVRLDRYNEPEPDLVLARFPDGPRAAPRPDQILLLIEVSDTTLRRDREVKLPRYARAGIPEVWIVVLAEQRIEVYREPEGEAYARQQNVEVSGAVGVESLAGIGAIPVEDFFG